MNISKEITAIESDYDAIIPKLDALLHRLRRLRRTGKVGKANLRRIRQLELDILECKDFFKHQGHL